MKNTSQSVRFSQNKQRKFSHFVGPKLVLSVTQKIVRLCNFHLKFSLLDGRTDVWFRDSIELHLQWQLLLAGNPNKSHGAMVRMSNVKPMLVYISSEHLPGKRAPAESSTWLGRRICAASNYQRKKQNKNRSGISHCEFRSRAGPGLPNVYVICSAVREKPATWLGFYNL